MNKTKTLNTYLEELSSNSPTPGGGNVSALCGTLASSLGIMVCNLTIGKKKYAEVENELSEIKTKMTYFQKTFLELASKDNDAFDKVMDAFKLPKENDEQRILRSNAIENATIEAANIPNEVINNCSAILPSLEIISKKGNQNSLSDAGVAISLILTTAQGAFLNVLINCVSLTNKNFANKMLENSEKNFNEIKYLSNKLISEIINKMKTQ